MQDNGTFIDTHTKITYKNWDEIKKKLAGVVIINDIPKPKRKEV